MWYRPMGVVNDWKSKKHNKQGNWHPDDGCLFLRPSGKELNFIGGPV